VESKTKHWSPSILLKLPLAVVQRTHLPRLQPSADAVEMKGVVTNTPGHGALLARRAGLIRLALDTQVHDMIPANSAVVHHNIPCPERDRIPLLDLKPLGALGDGT